MRALVTGGCGFIGSSLVSRLVKDGHEVDAVDNLSNGDLSALECDFKAIHPALLAYEPDDRKKLPGVASVITGDFADSTILRNILNRKYDVIFHLAANPRVQYSVEKPLESHEENTYKSIALFKAAAEAKTRVVFSSSSAIYGDVLNLPTRETSSPSPQSPYGLQKLHCEDYLEMFGNLYGLNSVSLRYFNVYGPGAYGDSPYATAIAAWCHAIHDGRPLRSDGDGTQTRDLVYVGDVVEANILAATCTSSQKSNKINIATGERYSNNEILDMLKERFDDLDIVHAPKREGDVQDTQGDTRHAIETLGFKATTSLAEGLEKTIEWWKSKNDKS